jgi:hypothetical protein
MAVALGLELEIVVVVELERIVEVMGYCREEEEKMVEEQEMVECMVVGIALGVGRRFVALGVVDIGLELFVDMVVALVVGRIVERKVVGIALELGAVVDIAPWM